MVQGKVRLTKQNFDIYLLVFQSILLFPMVWQNAKLSVFLRYNLKSIRDFRTAEIALYHTPGKLPEPEWTHTFW